jgi:hypothetical protein
MSTEQSRVFVGAVKAEKIQLETLLRASRHGDGIYLFIPKDIVDVYGLVAGDRVKVKLVEAYRVEREKAQITSEEKVEPVLVIPKVKRQRKRKLKVTETDFSGDRFLEIHEKESDQAEKTAVEEEDGLLLIDSEGKWKEEE